MASRLVISLCRHTDLYIFKPMPEISLERIKKRSRDGESNILII